MNIVKGSSIYFVLKMSNGLVFLYLIKTEKLFYLLLLELYITICIFLT